MIQFRKISINDKKKLDECFLSGSTDGSCYSFGSLFCWGESYSLEIADYDSLILMRGKDSFGRYYVYPSGAGDIKSAIEAMMDECRNEGCIFRFAQLLENNKNDLEKMFPDMFDISYDRDASEYIYSVKNMAELSGKKFHGKKGHVNAFFKNHDDISCDPITKDNIHYCLDIAKAWLDGKNIDDELAAELKAIENALDNYEKLGYDGAILFADGKAVAFTMGEPLKNNTFCTHFEKTLPDYRDAYPVINNGFTKLMLMNYENVNREEDLGHDGLRKAKLSYQPVALLDKFTAVLKSDPCRKYSVSEDDIPQLGALWKNVFGDEESITDFFLRNTVKLSDVYAYKTDGKIVSAFYLVDSQLVRGKDKTRSKYLYAAATLPEYRKKGIMGEMIEYAISVLKISGYKSITLYPADDRLYSYYKKFGFNEKIFARIYKLDSDELSKYKNQRYFNASVNYSDIREGITAENYVKFSGEYLDYALFCSENGGFIKSVVFDDEDKVFITGHVENGNVYADEAFSSEYNFEHILAVLADMNPDSVVLKTPVDWNVDLMNSTVCKDGMICLFDDSGEDEMFYLGQPCM